MRTILISIISIVVLVGCAATNPPSAPSVKNSSWEYVITNPASLKNL